MNTIRFDRFARAVGALSPSRRRLLTLLLGGVGGSGLLWRAPHEAAAGCLGAACGAGSPPCCAGTVCGPHTRCCRAEGGRCRKSGHCCSPADPCQRTLCTRRGRCLVKPKPEGAACGDGKTCQGGVCQCAAGTTCGDGCFVAGDACGDNLPACPANLFCCSLTPFEPVSARVPLGQPCGCHVACCDRPDNPVDCVGGVCCRRSGGPCTGDSAHLCCSGACNNGQCV